ncbi:hypothetical protein [Caldifermentibacillus hisashii]|uniref:hypothetical protein n=1 Tax=Caldifermentibacillus hisashii TaxID=996558 RepID=UPI001C0F7E40|nr:hypothetical protein [Caldifermentibacillus hisashii]MBU5342263.1 hypothetical protein [Caldifermentibacillus hisashii]
MKQVADRELFVVKGKTIEIFTMEDNTYLAFAHADYNADDEEAIIGMGEGDEKETAIKLALQDLYIELKNTR